MAGITPRLPLNFDSSNGYALIQETPEVIRQNFKNLLLTNPGERIMDPDFGVGIRKFLFENNVDSLRDIIKQKITSQIAKYMPFIQLTNLNVENDANFMLVTVTYFIIPLNRTNSLTIEIRI